MEVDPLAPLAEKNQQRMSMMPKREVYDKKNFKKTKTQRTSRAKRNPSPLNNIFEKIVQMQIQEKEVQKVQST